MYSIEEIKELAKTVSDLNLGKIKIKTDDEELVIEGMCCHVPPMPAMPPMMAAQSVPAMPAETVPAAESESQCKSGNMVKAPIVGTFYAAGSPDDAPYVKVGDSVKKGDVLMIIESMKLMNEVTSEYDGVVEEILVSNGDAVEYDQPLMRIC